MECIITNIVKQFGECDFTVSIIENNEILFNINKVLPITDDLDSKIEYERLKTIEQYINRPKEPNPNYITINIEEYNGANKLSCNISFYDMLVKNCIVNYELRNDYGVLESGKWFVDQITLDSWADDDMVIIDGLCNFLNINKL